MEQITLTSIQDRKKSFKAICDHIGVRNNTPAWPDEFGRAITKWIKDNHIPAIRTLSLFSGAGGLDIGFSDVGFQIVSSVELEEKFCETLNLNVGKGKYFDELKVNCTDIRSFSGDNLGKIDFIIGGPPCQTFSAAGRRANGVLGVDDERGVLFREYVRLLKKLSPKGFLFENVYGIIGAQKGKAWEEILQAFSEVGYKLYYRILDAADYGVPQHRERLIIVGLKEGEFKFPRPTHGPDSIDDGEFYTAKMAIEGVISQESDESNKLGGRYAKLLDDIPPGLNYSFYTEEMGNPNPVFAWRSKFSDFLYKADPDAPVRTIKASGGAYTGPLHWENRFFNYEEYKRLQTFPDNYRISGKKQIAVKQIGNSVPPQFARMMAIAIRIQVFNTHFPFEISFLEDNEELSFRKRKRKLTDIYRKKAKDAIESMRNENAKLPHSHSYYCLLHPNFKIEEVEFSKAEFQICVQWKKVLVITVGNINENRKEPVMEINIKSRNNNWTLNVENVILRIMSKSEKGFTIAWKAFERELVDNSIKADLIQLNGYYQYLPEMVCECKIENKTELEQVIKKVVERNETAAIMTTRQLAVQWNVEENEVMNIAEQLKQLGYEVRNHNTNPQIEKGSWLIPYSFPTLNPLSVQLHKRL